jgi:molybdate transport system ATP-binding protein
MGKTLVKMTGVDVRIGGRRVLTGIAWSLMEGESWAVVGANGAGKTSFLSLVRGDIWPAPDSRGQRVYCQGGYAGISPIGFRERTGLVSPELMDVYLQRGWHLAGLEVVCTGFWDTAFLHQKPSTQQLAAAQSLMNRLGIGYLKSKNILTMSQGEAKKVLIARGLVHRPAVLILDECCDGLDKASREKVLEIVQQAAEDGSQILYATHRLDELVPAITHCLILEDGQITECGQRDHVLKNDPVPSISTSRSRIRKLQKKRKQTGSLPYLFQASHANVYLDGKQVLREINWRINANENWAVLGPNGAGKTTLMRLISADLYPALGGKVGRFGGESPARIWEIKKRISYVSSRLQTDHRYPQSGFDTVLSGFFASIGLHDQPSHEQHALARYWIEFFGLLEIASRDIHTMSYGRLRKFLIARAMVTGPDLLLLDEPCDGLDPKARSDLLETLGELVENGTGIIYATHHLEEIGPWISHIFYLNRGRGEFQGPREDFNFSSSYLKS